MAAQNIIFSKHSRLLVLSLALVLWCFPAFSQKKVALVIGNAAYADVPLKNPVNDATDLAATLRNIGFTVTLRTNLNKLSMETAINTFKTGVSNGDVALFFYSGHGMQVSGSNYLIPVGEVISDEADVKYKAVDAQYIMDKLQLSGASVNIIILDACRDNPFRGARTQTKGFVAIHAPQGTVIAYSTAPNNIALDGTGRNSPYTKNLIACIQKPGLEIMEVFREVRKNVVNETSNRQTPWESTSLLDPFSLNGMVPKPATVQTTPSISEERTIVQYGSVEVTTEIAGALYIDGKYMKQVNANTLITLNTLTEGTHKVKISGDETVEKEVTISPNQTASVTIDKRRTDASSLIPDMVYVQGGTFQMGSNESDDEKPVHSVTVGSFYMGKYEVTQKQWRNIMGSDPPDLWFKGCDNCPVEGVSWDDVQEFIQKLNQRTGKNFRLPTEAEWEYAARGGNQSRGYKYSGSNNVDEVAWYDGNSGSKTHPVGQKRANELGLYDMTGNVWEWCSDWYGGDYYKSSPSSNPKGPSDGSPRVDRGGSWYDLPASQRVAYRYFYYPTNRGNSLGFRLARTE